MSFLLEPIVDATNGVFGPWSMVQSPWSFSPPPPMLGGQGVFFPFNQAPLFPSATPEIGRGFYGSGLFGGFFDGQLVLGPRSSVLGLQSSVFGPVSPLNLWGDDFYQHDKLAAGATLLGWGDTMLMTDPFLMHYRNWSSWPPIPFWPFSNPEQNSQQTPAQTQTAQNGQPAQGAGSSQHGKEVPIPEEAQQEIRAKAEELDRRQEKIREEAEKVERTAKEKDEGLDAKIKDAEEDLNKKAKALQASVNGSGKKEKKPGHRTAPGSILQ